MGDFELWEAFKSGHVEAFSLIYRQNFSDLHRYGSQFIGEKEVLLDCIQSLFTDIWNSKENLGPTTSIKFYLYRSLRRRIVRERKSRKNFQNKGMRRHLEFEFVAPYEDEIMQTERVEERKALVNKLMNCLSSRQREALFLKYNSGLSNDEISEVMALKIKTIYNLIYSALQVLKEEVQARHISISTSVPIVITQLAF